MSAVTKAINVHEAIYRLQEAARAILNAFEERFGHLNQPTMHLKISSMNEAELLELGGWRRASPANRSGLPSPFTTCETRCWHASAMSTGRTSAGNASRKSSPSPTQKRKA